MTITDEISHFDDSMIFLESIYSGLVKCEVQTATNQELFLAEAIAFRLFRNFERITRAVFLESCMTLITPSGKPIKSKLICSDWKTAEEILKAGNRFLDWGNIENTRSLASLVFEHGFPISDMLAPVNSSLTSLQAIRNFIAHDSTEAARKFRKIVPNYLQPSANPDSAAKLLLGRRNLRQPQTLRVIMDHVKTLTVIYGQL